VAHRNQHRTDRKTPNELALDRAVLHALFLEGYKNREAVKLLASIDARLYPEIERIIRLGLRGTQRRGLGRAYRNSAALRTMRKLIRERAGRAIREASATLRNDLRSLSTQEADHAVGSLAIALALGREADRARIRASLVEPTGVSDEVQARTFEGAGLADHFETATASLVRDSERTVLLGVSRGDSDEEILAGLLGGGQAGRGVFEKSRTGLLALLIAAIAHTSAQARELAFEANQRRVAGVQWVATLDSRTCLECLGLDGQRFPLGEGPRPPAHMKCRCTTAPVILGVPVAKELTAQEWLEGQPVPVQNEALGKARAVEFRRGTFTVRDFTDMRGRVLTLDELRAREPEAFQ